MSQAKLKNYLQKHNFLIFSIVALIVSIYTTSFAKSTVTTIQIMSGLSLCFFGWALVHHYFDKSLKKEVMVEYLLTIALVLVIIYSFLI